MSYLLLIILFVAQIFWSQNTAAQDTTSTSTTPSPVQICLSSYENYTRAVRIRSRACPTDTTNCEEQIQKCSSMLETLFPETENDPALGAFKNECGGMLGSLSGADSRIKQRMERLSSRQNEDVEQKLEEYQEIKNQRDAKVRELEQQVDELTNGVSKEGEKSLSEMSLSELETETSDLASSNTEMNIKMAQYQKTINDIQKKMAEAKKAINDARKSYRKAETAIVKGCDSTAEKRLEAFDNKFRARKSSQRKTVIRAKLYRKYFSHCMRKKASAIDLSHAREDYTEALNNYQQGLSRLTNQMQEQEQQLQVDLQEIERSKRERFQAIQAEKQRRISELEKITQELARVKNPSREEMRLERALEEASETRDKQETVVANLTTQLGDNVINPDEETQELLNNILRENNFEYRKQDAIADCCQPPTGNEETQYTVRDGLKNNIGGADTLCTSTEIPQGSTNSGGGNSTNTRTQRGTDN